MSNDNVKRPFHFYFLLGLANYPFHYQRIRLKLSKIRVCGILAPGIPLGLANDTFHHCHTLTL